MEWENSLATEAGINGCWACWSCVGQARYLFWTCTCLNNHFITTAKIGNLLKFVAGAVKGKHRKNGEKRPLICQHTSLYPKLSYGDWGYWQKKSPLPFSWDVSEQFDVNLHSPTSLERKSFPHLYLVQHLAALQVWTVGKFSSASSSSENVRYIHFYMSSPRHTDSWDRKEQVITL